MACNSAAWVFGGVRLISSASNTWVKTGPFVSSRRFSAKLNRLVPITSPGIRSGVNWIRPKARPRLAAKQRASIVLAVPGTPSISVCPAQSRLTSSRWTAAS